MLGLIAQHLLALGLDSLVCTEGVQCALQLTAVTSGNVADDQQGKGVCCRLQASQHRSLPAGGSARGQRDRWVERLWGGVWL